MKSILGQLLNGRYLIVRQLEQKSSCITYIAEDRQNLHNGQLLVKQFVLSNTSKIINDYDANSEFKNLLVREISRIRQFNYHNQIPPVLDYILWGHELLLIRKFIPGETLKEEIAERKLEEYQVINLLKQTLSALDFIHKAGEMHLNLKPSNIIFERQSSTIFITDFDHLKYLLKNTIVQSEIIATTSIIENNYLAPEQKKGKPNFSSDFYALGNIAIQALTGKDPHQIRLCNLDNYARASLVDLETSQTTNVSSQLANVLHNLINENPELRYQSSQAILHSLAQPENVVILPDLNTVPFQNVTSKKLFKFKNYRKKHKIFGIIWGLIGIITLGLLAFKFIIESRKNQYQNFAEYRNKSYDIVIKYPQEWTVKELEDPITGEIVVFTSPLENKSDSFQEKIYLSIDRLPTTKENYEKTIINRIQNTSEITNIDYQLETANLANQKAKSITYQRKEGNMSLQQKEIFTVKNGKVYLLTYIAEKSQYQNFLKLVNKIIKSFNIEI